VRALAHLLAATLALAGCKSDDKPKAPPPAEKPPELPTAGTAKDQASEAVDTAKETADSAADKTKRALDAVRDRAQAAGDMARAAGDLARDRAAEAITDAKALRELLATLDDQIAKGLDRVKEAASDADRATATAALEKLKAEKQKLEARIAELRGKEEAKSP
jgi:hypothetical protein